VNGISSPGIASRRDAAIPTVTFASSSRPHVEKYMSVTNVVLLQPKPTVMVMAQPSGYES